MANVKVKQQHPTEAPEVVESNTQSEPDALSAMRDLKEKYRPVDGELKVELGNGRSVTLKELSARKSIQADRLSDGSQEDLIAHRSTFAIVEYSDGQKPRKFNFLDANDLEYMNLLDNKLTSKDLFKIKTAYMWAFEIELGDELKNE